MGPNSIKQGQTGPNKAKWGQLGPNGAKWGKNRAKEGKTILSMVTILGPKDGDHPRVGDHPWDGYFA